jgi:hypothetical protein
VSADTNLAMIWTDAGGAVLTGTPTLDTSCTPLLHTDVWRPVATEDPFAASVVNTSGGHAFVLEDADRILALNNAILSVPYSIGTAWIGLGNGVWTQASTSSSGSSTRITLGNRDLSIPLRILASGGGSTPVGIVYAPRPNPSRNGAPIHFPLSGSKDGESLEILAADGTAIRRFEASPGKTEIVWDVRNGSGHLVKPGVYWYVWRGVSGARRGELLVAN